MLNAILWTAGVKVPNNGVQSPTPSDEEMHSNLDPKGRKAPRKKAAKAAPKAPARKPAPPGPPPSFQELRERAVRRLDARTSLNLLAQTLRIAFSPRTQFQHHRDFSLKLGQVLAGRTIENTTVQ